MYYVYIYIISGWELHDYSIVNIQDLSCVIMIIQYYPIHYIYIYIYTEDIDGYRGTCWHLQDRRGLFGCLHIVLRDCAHDEAMLHMPWDFSRMSSADPNLCQVECRSIIFDHEAHCWDMLGYIIMIYYDLLWFFVNKLRWLQYEVGSFWTCYDMLWPWCGWEQLVASESLHPWLGRFVRMKWMLRPTNMPRLCKKALRTCFVRVFFLCLSHLVPLQLPQWPQWLSNTSTDDRT